MANAIKVLFKTIIAIVIAGLALIGIATLGLPLIQDFMHDPTATTIRAEERGALYIHHFYVSKEYMEDRMRDLTGKELNADNWPEFERAFKRDMAKNGISKEQLFEYKADGYRYRLMVYFAANKAHWFSVDFK